MEVVCPWMRSTSGRPRAGARGSRNTRYDGILNSCVSGGGSAPFQQPPPGQRRLYLAIEGQDARAVALAKAEMKRVLNEETLNLAAGGSRSQSAMANYGKYSLV